MTQLLHYLERQNDQARHAINLSTHETYDRVLEHFIRFEPPIFLGLADDAKAEQWLDSIEKLFGVLGYDDSQKLRLATFRLEAAAGDWWRACLLCWERDKTLRTWENFVVEFQRQYVPSEVRELTGMSLST